MRQGLENAVLRLYSCDKKAVRHRGDEHIHKPKMSDTNKKTITTHVANVFVYSWIVPYGIPTKVLTNNSVQFTGKLFSTLFTTNDAKHLMTTAYHLQIIGQVEKYIRILAIILQHYVAGNHRD